MLTEVADNNAVGLADTVVALRLARRRLIQPVEHDFDRRDSLGRFTSSNSTLISESEGLRHWGAEVMEEEGRWDG